MSHVPPDTTHSIADAATTPNPTNDQVRQYLGGGSLSHISPVMRAFRTRLREQRAEQTAVLLAELLPLVRGDRKMKK